MNFAVDGALWERFPGLVIGVVVGHDLHPPADAAPIEALLRQAEERWREEWAGRPVREHPCIAPWREMFRAMGLPAARFHSSIEALARRALSERGVPRLLPLVDLYNAVSLTHGLPMGGHNIAAFEGDVRLAPTQGGEPFRAIFSEETELVGAGEIAYLDERKVLTRHWVWRQCHQDRITPQTRSVFIPIDGLAEAGLERVRMAVEEMAEHLATRFRARVQVAFVTEKERAVPLER